MNKYHATAQIYDLEIEVASDTDLDSTFLCTCLDTGEPIAIDGYLFTFDLIEDQKMTLINSSVVNWGSDVIPTNAWIDITKSYKCGGKRVIYLRMELHNSVGEEVTYPIKGTVVLRERPFKTVSYIWSLDGRRDVVWGRGENLILDANELIEDQKNGYV